MASKKRTQEASLKMIVDEMSRSQSVVLEDMRSQNRMTIEAVEASRLALEQRIDRLDQETRARDASLELAVRNLSVTVQQNTLGIQQNSLDIQDLSGKVDALARLEARVAALERRSA